MSDIAMGPFVLRHSQTPGQFSIMRGHACVAVGRLRKGALELSVYGGECPSKAAILAALRGESKPLPKLPAPEHADTAVAPVAAHLEIEPAPSVEETAAIMEAKAELRAMASSRRAKKAPGKE